MEIATRRGHNLTPVQSPHQKALTAACRKKLIKLVDFCAVIDISGCDDTYLEPRATTTYAPLGVPVLLREAATSV